MYNGRQSSPLFNYCTASNRDCRLICWVLTIAFPTPSKREGKNPQSPSPPSKRQRQNSLSPSTPRKTSSAAVKSNASIDDCGQQNVVDLTAPASTPLQIHVPQTPWVPSLNLSTADKSIILDGEWLNDKIVDAANRIVAAHLGLSAPQTSLLAQSSEGFTSLRADDTSMQILYDAGHWITAACVDGEVYVANSLGNNIMTFRQRLPSN